VPGLRALGTRLLCLTYLRPLPSFLRAHTLENQCFEVVFVPNTAAGQLRILTGFPRAGPKGRRRATRTVYRCRPGLSSELGDRSATGNAVPWPQNDGSAAATGTAALLALR